MTDSRRRRGAIAAFVCAAALLAAAGPLAPSAGAADPPAPLCPAAAGNARFVRFIYLTILERCPDAAAATYWTGRLDGGLSRYAFAEAIDMSNENVIDHNVVPLYQDVLGRAPTANELAAGIAEIRVNHQDAHLLAMLFSSDEAYAKIAGDTPQAKDEAWLKEAFKSVLERDPDAAALTYYKGRLGAGGSTAATRMAVGLALELSNENMAGWTGAVFGAGLHRAPDEAGFGYWFGWLIGPGHRQTFRLWTHILSSAEANGIAQTQPNPPPDEH